jgi:hypothetical protein
VFGYRMVRNADFDDLQRRVTVLYEKLDTQRVESAATLAAAMARHARDVAELSAAVSAAKEQAASRLALYETLVPRLNVLETENAQFRSKMTGLPALAPQVVKGTPIMSERIGAGADLFEDVGDTMAEELSARGLLHPGTHANGEHVDRLPSAAAMLADFGEGR